MWRDMVKKWNGTNWKIKINITEESKNKKGMKGEKWWRIKANRNIRNERKIILKLEKNKSFQHRSKGIKEGDKKIMERAWIMIKRITKTTKEWEEKKENM